MKSGNPRLILLVVVGLCSLAPYLAARGLQDLRQNTVGFEVAFFSAFVLYIIAVALVLRPNLSAPIPRPQSAIRNPRLWLIFLFAILFRLSLLPTHPTLSDDMYRYVWDGRVQAHGLSPYAYPPLARELYDLRRNDKAVWRYINRKEAVSVYPPGAQLAYAGLWRVVGDSVMGFKTAFSMAELLGAVLLMRLLRHFHVPSEYVLIYLWSPLLVFEVAHAGHVDGLMLPLLIAAFWARVRGRPTLLGMALGAATLVKLFPALLLPALLPWPRPVTWKGLRVPLLMLAAFAGIVLLGYLPYLRWSGDILGFLPKYFGENFNLGLAHFLFDIAPRLGLEPSMLANAVTFIGLAALGLIFILRPAASGRDALVRCVWLMGWYTLVTQNLFPWYVLWLLPLLALFLEPGESLGFKPTAMFAWLVFSGTVALSYLFFIRWRVIPAAQAAEYVPLYLLLLASLAVRFGPRSAEWLRAKAKTRRAEKQTVSDVPDGENQSVSAV